VAVWWNLGVQFGVEFPATQAASHGIEVAVPGTADLQLQRLLFDVNGTLTTAGS
jgi:hypothetical protein